MSQGKILKMLLCSAMCGALLVGTASSDAYAAKKSKKTAAPAQVENTATVQQKLDEEMSSLVPVDPANQAFFNTLVSTYETNPELVSARAETRAVFQQLPIADSNWKPNVKADGSVTGADTSIDPGLDDTYTTVAGEVNVTQPIFRGGRTISDINVAQSSIRAALASLDSREQKVLLDAITAYADVIRDQGAVKLNQSNVDVLTRQMDATRVRFDVGDVTRTDVAQSESRQSRAKADLVKAQGDYKATLSRFEKITGMTATDLALPASGIEMPESLETAVKTGLDWNPDLRAAVHNKRAAGYNINSKLGEHLPEVSLRAGFSSAKDPSPILDQQDSATLGVVATVPLYEGGATSARVKQARQTFNARNADIAATDRTVRELVTSRWEDWQAAKAEIDARKEQVRASGVARFGTKKEADFGARSVLDTLDSDQELLEAQIALITARRDEVVARYGLLAAMGILSPKYLGFGDRIPDYNREISSARHGF